MKFNEIVSRQTVEELAKASGAKTPQVEKLVKEAVPVLMESMYKNAADEEGAAALARALNQHAASGADSSLANVDVVDGGKILTHVLGADKKKVSKQLSRAAGLKNNQTTLLLALLAPLLLNALGNTAQQTNTNNAGGLGGLLGTLLGLGGGGNGTGSLLTSLLGMGGGSSSYNNNSGGSWLSSLFGLGGGSGTYNNSNQNQNNSGAELLGSLLGGALSGDNDQSDGTPVAQTLGNAPSGSQNGGDLAGMLVELLLGK